MCPLAITDLFFLTSIPSRRISLFGMQSWDLSRASHGKDRFSCERLFSRAVSGVTFTKKGANISAYCTCPAGENGQYCKHRFGILAGSFTNVISANADDIALVSSWLPGSDIEAAWVEVKRLEHEAEQIKSQLSNAKKALAKAMRD